MKDIIFNGVPWFDQNGNTVNAHGACIVREHDTYYLFGEYKTDDKNMYNGFSCYSSKNLADWKFEGMALAPDADKMLYPDRVGERVKVVKSRKGERISNVWREMCKFDVGWNKYRWKRHVK